MKNILIITLLITTMSFTNAVYPEINKENVFNNNDGFVSGEEYSEEEPSGEVSGDISGEGIVDVTQIIENFNSTMQYYIRVNRTQNVVNIYSKNEDGSYSPYKAMLCSIGAATPAAGKTYKVTTYRARWNALQGNVYGQYATQIIGNILFHSVPYTAKKNSALEYWEYDKLGTDASLGCVRLTVENAKWVYDNIASGTTVEFYEDENPGPFGKPELVTISDNVECRNWDPTDLAEGNPWRTTVGDGA